MQHVREETLIRRAFVKLVHGIHVSHARDIAERDLVWAYPHHRPILLEEALDRLALAQSAHMVLEPCI